MIVSAIADLKDSERFFNKVLAFMLLILAVISLCFYGTMMQAHGVFSIADATIALVANALFIFMLCATYDWSTCAFVSSPTVFRQSRRSYINSLAWRILENTSSEDLILIERILAKPVSAAATHALATRIGRIVSESITRQLQDRRDENTRKGELNGLS